MKGDSEQWSWALYGAFLGAVAAFAFTPILGSILSWPKEPILAWYAVIAIPLCAGGGFTLVWRLFR